MCQLLGWVNCLKNREYFSGHFKRAEILIVRVILFTQNKNALNYRERLVLGKSQLIAECYLARVFFGVYFSFGIISFLAVNEGLTDSTVIA